MTRLSLTKFDISDELKSRRSEGLFMNSFKYENIKIIGKKFDIARIAVLTCVTN